MNRILYRFDDEDLVVTERIRPIRVWEAGAVAWMVVWVLIIGSTAFAGTWTAAALLLLAY